MSEVLLHSMIDKMNTGEKKMDQLIELTQNLPSKTQISEQIKTSAESVRSDFQKSTFPVEVMRQISVSMERSAAVFKQPVKQEVIHHHHLTKVIWVTAALFLLVCVITSGWYITASKVDLYKSNDTKYRYLKLQKDKTLMKYLRGIDSLNAVNPQMRDAVIAEEDQREKDFEMMQTAMEMEKEARDLRDKVGRQRK